jgi:signal transduction histidine kinase
LKKIVCLLSCHPRNMAVQLPQSLDCLRSSLEAQAVGIYWRDDGGELRPLVQRPARFHLDESLRRVIAGPDGRPDPEWGDTPVPWLSAPMKVGGTVMGRLWVVAETEYRFSQAEREFATMAGNQLALAMENSRLYDDVQQLAARRGKLLGRVIAAQDERCRRISRELHDEISQSLAAMALDLEAAQLAGSAVREGALERLGDLRGRLLRALGEVNRIILDLRPTLLEDMGMLSALRWYAGQRLDSLGVMVHVQSAGVDERLQPHVETTVYRIAQEAVTNVAKHAGASNVWLSARRTNRHFTLSVRDDGRGFDPSSVLSDPDDRVGIGLFGMRERASLVGGRSRSGRLPAEALG